MYSMNRIYGGAMHLRPNWVCVCARVRVHVCVLKKITLKYKLLGL